MDVCRCIIDAKKTCGRGGKGGFRPNEHVVSYVMSHTRARPCMDVMPRLHEVLRSTMTTRLPGRSTMTSRLPVTGSLVDW